MIKIIPSVLFCVKHTYLNRLYLSSNSLNKKRSLKDTLDSKNKKLKQTLKILFRSKFLGLEF
jgi:ATP/ADP translocase